MLKPDSWHALPHGEQIQQQVEQHLQPWWPRVFGYHLLKLGHLSSQVSSLHCSVSRHYNVFEADLAELGAEKNAKQQVTKKAEQKCELDDQQSDIQANIVADIHHLPIQNKSTDAILSAFNLEFESDPYQLLREMDRVLVSGGYLFIVGFNPISPLFAGKLLPKYQTQLPWCGHLFMPSRIKDWLGLLGFQVQSDERFMFDSLLTTNSTLKSLQDKLQSWLPNTGSVYLIVARKIEMPLTRVKSKREQRAGNWSPAPSAGRSAKLSSQVITNTKQ
ncbi:class I SAM-dependent methyltransferase [Shewanella sp. WXL01]|nr:class I SAM-dependent methyltransferase [Shewanella sp. WXL01]